MQLFVYLFCNCYIFNLLRKYIDVAIKDVLIKYYIVLYCMRILRQIEIEIFYF